ncbi:hypothetical protein AX16_008997 [Volvariella volvacea WC 439]|nr:hypothetical protein AX16_008997 [Volvariella volvacea WC 439]
MFASSSSSSRSTSRPSGVPFTSNHDADEDEDDVFNLSSIALRGRRKWKKGQEKFDLGTSSATATSSTEHAQDAANTNENDTDSDSAPAYKPLDDPKYKKNKPHILKGGRTLMHPLPEALKKPGIVLKAQNDRNKGKSARDAIMDNTGVGKDLRSFGRKVQKQEDDSGEPQENVRAAPVGFMKPAGVDDPSTGRQRTRPNPPIHNANNEREEAEAEEDGEANEDLTLPQLTNREREPVVKRKAKAPQDQSGNIIQGARDKQNKKFKQKSGDSAKKLNPAEQVKGLGLELLGEGASKGKRERVDDGDGTVDAQKKKRKKKQGVVNFVE